jgi:hypothetical protein
VNHKLTNKRRIYPCAISRAPIGDEQAAPSPEKLLAHGSHRGEFGLESAELGQYQKEKLPAADEDRARDRSERQSLIQESLILWERGEWLSQRAIWAGVEGLGDCLSKESWQVQSENNQEAKRP